MEFPVIPPVCNLESLRSLSVTPESGVCSLALESAFIPEPRIWSHYGVWSLETIRNIECRILMYSGFCSLDPLRSL